MIVLFFAMYGIVEYILDHNFVLFSLIYCFILNW